MGKEVFPNFILLVFYLTSNNFVAGQRAGRKTCYWQIEFAALFKIFLDDVFQKI
jgi:hypothetical protein